MTGDRGGPNERATFASDHERARTRLAEQMDEPLWAEESAWLQDHLGRCADCRRVADEYAAQREALRALRPPMPPRDLWARTSAALDMLEARSRRAAPRRIAPPPRDLRDRPRHAAPVRPARRSWAPLGFVGAIAAVFVASFLIGSQVLQAVPKGGIVAIIATPIPTAIAPAATSPGPTPLKVAIATVHWAETQPQEAGTTKIVSSDVDSVCPSGATDCAPIESSSTIVTVPVAATSIWSSPSNQQLVVVGRGKGTSSSSVFVANVDGTAVVTASPSPSESASPSVRPSSTASSSPSQSPVPPSASPSTAANVLAIASDVVVIGQSAAYSADGKWFAFTARPAGGAAGPDIYRWRVGAAEAQAVTTDHRSVFSGWAGNLMLGSTAGRVEVSPPVAPSTEPSASPAESPASPSPASSPTDSASPDADSPAPESPADSAAPSVAASDGSARSVPRSFVIDPNSGVSADLAAPAWRPVVDPTGKFVVYWDGTVAVGPSGDAWPTVSGRLVVASWQQMQAGATGAELQSRPLPSSLAVDGADWDAQWDETGEHLAIWAGNRANPAVGRVSFLTIDRATGAALTGGPRLAGAPALRGIALVKGHLTWATPPTQGQPSVLKVYAWNGPDAGTRIGASSGELVVVVH